MFGKKIKEEVNTLAGKLRINGSQLMDFFGKFGASLAIAFAIIVIILFISLIQMIKRLPLVFNGAIVVLTIMLLVYTYVKLREPMQANYNQIFE